MNRDLQYIITGFTGLVVAGLLLIFVLLPPEDAPPIPIQPIGEEIPGSPDEEEDDSPPVPMNFTEEGRDQLHIYDNITVTIVNGSSGSAQSNGSQGSGGSGGGNGGGGGGGGGSSDRTPPTVTGIFSRPPDTGDGWYTHPFTVTWVGEDDRSGIDFCDPPTNYSGPDGGAIVLEGHCTDKAGNQGTGHVTFNYNSTRFVPLLSYGLTLSSGVVDVGSNISSTATTNDTSITNVVFVWKDPSNSTETSSNKTVTLGNATDIFTAPNKTGLWTVDAQFKNSTGAEIAVLSKTFTVSSTAGSHVYTLALDRDTVQANSTIFATAGTNNTGITDVLFVWTDPVANLKGSHTQILSSNGIAQDSFVPDIQGEWKIDAHFNNGTLIDIAVISKSFSVTADQNGGGGGNGTDNHAPIAVDDSVTTPENVPVLISVLANDSDPDGDPISLSSFTQAGNGAVTNNGNGTVTYTPAENFNGLDSFTYEISDGALVSAPANVTILVTPSEGLPTANAGPDQSVDEEVLVSLNGSASDNVTVVWSQTSGTSVTLINPGSLIPTFLAPAISHSEPLSMQLTFELKVTDGHGSSASDTVVITVNDVNKSPVANAGPDQTVDEKDIVNLEGSASDPDGDTLSFGWRQTEGPSVELSDTSSPTPSFTAPQVTGDTELIFELEVNDGFGGLSRDTVTIMVLDKSGGGGGGGSGQDNLKVTGGSGQLEKGVNFGFTVQLNERTERVRGNIEFQDKSNDINLHSISVTSLTIQGNQAIFEGTATINGEGEYSFIVNAEDNGEPGNNDKFSISIPELGYDVSGTINRGNIQVHS